MILVFVSKHQKTISFFLLTNKKLCVIMDTIHNSIHQTVEVEITVIMLLQRARDDENRVKHR